MGKNASEWASWHESLTWLIHIPVCTVCQRREYMWYESICDMRVYVIWEYMWYESICDMTHSSAWRNLCTCMTWLLDIPVRAVHQRRECVVAAQHGVSAHALLANRWAALSVVAPAVLHMDESCLICDCVTSHSWRNLASHLNVLFHRAVSCCVWIVARKWIMSSIRMSNVALMNTPHTFTSRLAAMTAVVVVLLHMN